MDALFAEPQELKSKKFDYYLHSDDPQEWLMEAQDLFEQQFPELTQFPIEFSYEKVSPEMGSAVGRIIVTIGDESIIFPLIIRDKKLSPFDVFIYKEKYYPATDLRIQAIILKQSSFAYLTKGVPADTTTALVKSYFPPVAIAGLGPIKTAESLLSRIGYGISQNEKEALLRKIAQISESSISPSAQIIIKTIQTAVVPAKSISPDLNQNIPWDIIQIRRDGDEYFLYFGSSKFIVPFKTKISPKQLQMLLKGDLYNKAFIDPRFSYLIKYPSYLRGTVKIIPATQKSDFTVIKSPQKIQISNESGRITGYTFPIKYNPSSICDKLLFLSEDGHYYIDTDIFGVPIGPNDSTFKNDYQSVQPSDLIVFINSEDKTALGPFIVTSVVHERNRMNITTPDIEIMYSLDEKIPNLKSKKELARYVIDDNCLVLVNYIVRKLVSQFVPSTVNPDTTLAKIAVQKIDNRFIINGFKVNSPDDLSFLSRFAENIPSHSSNYSDLEFTLAHLGLTPDEINSIAKLSEVNTVYIIPEHIPKEFNYNNYINRSRILHKIATDIRKEVTDEIIKSAINTEDPETLDKILALKVITPETMAEFINAIPEFESIIQRLSKLLIATRLGADFNESSLENTITFLDEIVKKLKLLELTTKK